MKNLNLKVYGLTSLQNVNVQINGKTISCARNEFDAFETNFQTEDEVVEVRVVRNLELAGKFWWLFAFLTYVISFFGIFQAGYEKNCNVFDCVWQVHVQPYSAVTLRFDPSAVGAAATVQANVEVTEISNVAAVDVKARRRRKWLIALRIVSFIAVIAVIAALLAK